MKKLVAMILVLVMVFSFSSIAMAAASPTGGTTTGSTSGTTGGTAAPAKVVEVAEPSTEGKAALEAAVEEQLKGQVAEGETAQVIASFSAPKAGKIEANAAGVKAGDKVFVLFRTADGKIKLIKAQVKDGKVIFTAPGAGDFTIVKVAAADGAATVPATGDSNRLMKLVLVGVAAISVMTVAGVAIKRSNG